MWTSKGYLDVGVWKHLQNYVTSDVLPSYSEMIHMRRLSQFGSLQPSTDFRSGFSGTIPGPEGKQILSNAEKYQHICIFVHKSRWLGTNTFELMFCILVLNYVSKNAFIMLMSILLICLSRLQKLKKFRNLQDDLLI